MITFIEYYFSCWHCNSIQGKECPRSQGLYLLLEKRKLRAFTYLLCCFCKFLWSQHHILLVPMFWFYTLFTSGAAAHLLLCYFPQNKVCWGSSSQSLRLLSWVRWEGNSVPETTTKHFKLGFKTLLKSLKHLWINKQCWSSCVVCLVMSDSLQPNEL